VIYVFRFLISALNNWFKYGFGASLVIYSGSDIDAFRLLGLFYVFFLAYMSRSYNFGTQTSRNKTYYLIPALLLSIQFVAQIFYWMFEDFFTLGMWSEALGILRRLDGVTEWLQAGSLIILISYCLYAITEIERHENENLDTESVDLRSPLLPSSLKNSTPSRSPFGLQNMVDTRGDFSHTDELHLVSLMMSKHPYKS